MVSTSIPDPDRSPVLKAFGQTVRECRKARGFSQESFAYYCGLDRSYMGSVERGGRNVTLVNIERIISALHMKPSEFFLALDSHFRPITILRSAVHPSDSASALLRGLPPHTS